MEVFVFRPLPSLYAYIQYWCNFLYFFGWVSCFVTVVVQVLYLTYNFRRSRLLYAQFCAALIQDTSDYPLEVLKAVPYAGWCIEVQRFIGKSQLTIFAGLLSQAFVADQIRAQSMTLTGCKFFSLTRKSILAVIWVEGCDISGERMIWIADADNDRDLRTCAVGLRHRLRSHQHNHAFIFCITNWVINTLIVFT
jgi:hypothetical protein